MRYGPSADAPTHLGSHQLGLPPEWLPDEQISDHAEIVTSAVRGGRAVPQASMYPSRSASVSALPLPEPQYRRVPTERSAGAAFPPEEAPYRRIPTERSASPVEVPSPRALPPKKKSRDKDRDRKREEKRDDKREKRESSKAVAAPAPAPTPERSSNKGSSKSERSSSKNIAAPTPQAPAQQQRASAPAIEASPGGINAIDPLAVPVPPELGAPIYGWVRRLALQADLAGADRVLRDALLDLTSSLSVTIVYPGPDGLWSLGADEEIPRDAQPIIAVAQARRAVVSSHTAIIPVITTSETVAVVTLTRNPRNPAYHPVEQIAMIALIRESAAILHHLAVTHLQKAAEINADKGGLYRGEALEAHRSRGHEGVPINLTPSWVKRTYPILIVTLLVAVVVSVFITVPTYSTGQGVVILQGTTVTASAGGVVDQILVQQGDKVRAGQILVKLHSANEEAELAQATSELNNSLTTYMQDQTDDTAKKSLANATARKERAQAAVDQRVIRARRAGVISDRRVQQGQALQVGDHIAQIVDPATEPEVIAFLPGKDRPRLKVGQTLQVELGGYKKIRELATITSVSNEVIGGNEAAKVLGQQLADALKLQGGGGNYVIVKARLPKRTFETENRTYYYHHGMLAVTEVKIQSKPFLVTLLPALEKYLPD